VLPAVSFGDRFFFSIKGETGGGGWVHPKGADSIAISELSFRNTLVGSHLAWCPFPARKLFSQSGRAFSS